MIKKMILTLIVAVMILISSACNDFVIKKSDQYPEAQFNAAYKALKAIHESGKAYKGKVNKVNVLIYVGDEKQMISFSVSKETAQGFLAGTNMVGNEIIKEQIKEHGDLNIDIDKLNLKCLTNLDTFGPGLVADVKVTDDDVHLLIWLD